MNMGDGLPVTRNISFGDATFRHPHSRVQASGSGFTQAFAIATAWATFRPPVFTGSLNRLFHGAIDSSPISARSATLKAVSLIPLSVSWVHN